MTDDELVERLRRLGRPPGQEPDWQAMAADVRAAYEAELRNRDSENRLRNTDSEIGRRRRRRRWVAAPVAGALALAAAFTLWVRLHPAPVPAMRIDEDAASLVDEADPNELIDELTPAQLDRVAEVLKKGA